jgi:hypothetical protein
MSASFRKGDVHGPAQYTPLARLSLLIGAEQSQGLVLALWIANQNPPVSERLHRQVQERARRSCEYCLLYEEDRYSPREPDQISAEKHAGTTFYENLA